MPQSECYLEVGTLEGRTLESAAIGNDGKLLVGCDPCEKYQLEPESFPPNVKFLRKGYTDLCDEDLPLPVGLTFYDGDHSAFTTADFLRFIKHRLADEAVIVLDDWDRESVREGAFSVDGYQLLRECPEYTDGLSTAQHHFGYSFGIGIFGFRR